MVPRSSYHAHPPLGNNGRLPLMVRSLPDRNHAPLTTQSHHPLPPFTFPPGTNVSEDAAGDIVSMYSESSSPTVDSADTAHQDTDDEGEGEDFEASSNDSRKASPDTALTHNCNEWLPTATRAGYFVFPDPFSAGEGTGSAPEPIESQSAVTSDNRRSTVVDTATSTGVSRGKSAERNPTVPPKKEANRFLPLLKDEPNYPRNQTLNRGLEKINQRLTRAATHAEERPTQFSETRPALGIRPAFRKVESSSDVNTKEFTDLKAEIKQLKAVVKALQRSTTSTDSWQAEAVRHLRRNQERLIGGWERMRDELLQIKIMQEQLGRRVNMERNMEGRW